jgi:hypothetical protein
MVSGVEDSAGQCSRSGAPEPPRREPAPNRRPDKHVKNRRRAGRYVTKVTFWRSPDRPKPRHGLAWAASLPASGILMQRHLSKP